MGCLWSSFETLPPVRDVHYDAWVARLPNDLSGRTFVITGTTSGTGRALAQLAAERGATVVMLNRASSRAEEALESLRSANPQGEVSQITCDLASNKSVRKAAEEVLAAHASVDALVLNSGIMAFADERSEDGFDVQMATNHLGHFLLTSLLWPLLLAAGEARGEARVVAHSSVLRLGKPLQERFFEKRPAGALGGNGTQARLLRYQQTKLANIVFARALERKIKAAGLPIKAVTAHPGGSATPLLVQAFKNGAWPRFVTVYFLSRLAQSERDGALGIITCAVAEDVENGDFWGPGQKKNSYKGAPRRLKREKLSDDEAAQELLWRKSEEATGCSFEVV